MRQFRQDALRNPPDAKPHGKTHTEKADLAHNVRSVVLHRIEETARHAGHLDIARDLLDDRTGLGARRDQSSDPLELNEPLLVYVRHGRIVTEPPRSIPATNA
ncbi:MAG: DUF664 domain-containing protein [Acidimicrobiia bacterium]|nr:DUF664 domain-containing protein [Acidimicrobiia bacterium]